MADRRVQARGPMKIGIGALQPKHWDLDDEQAQDARWYVLSFVGLNIVTEEDGTQEIKPRIADDPLQYRLVQLRCGGDRGRCGKVTGAVYAVDELHDGTAFTWAEVFRIADAEARPPTIKAWHVVLDGRTANFDLSAECVKHGRRALPVRVVRDALPGAVGKLAATGKSTTMVMGDGAA